MKEKLKTAAIIILLIISLILVIGCKTNRFYAILPGHSQKSMPVIEKEYNRFTDEFETADSMFNEKYKFPLTR